MKDERIVEMNLLASDCVRSFHDLVIEQGDLSTLPDYNLFGDIDAAVLTFIKTNLFSFGTHREDLVRTNCISFIMIFLSLISSEHSF